MCISYFCRNFGLSLDFAGAKVHIFYEIAKFFRLKFCASRKKHYLCTRFQSKVFQNSQFSILETQTLNFFRKKFLFESNTFTFEYV